MKRENSFLMTTQVLGPPSAPTVVYMWVSSTNTDGNIGGVNGATTICEGDAAGITGLAAGLTHRAVIATSSNDPRNYFSNNPSVQRPDGTAITDTYADFFDPTVTARNAVSGSYSGIWTGLESSGTWAGSNRNCNDWSSASAVDAGTNGTADRLDIARFYNITMDPCNSFSNYRVLCISY